VALVTGAASGIGLGIASALAQIGGRVAMVDIDEAALQNAVHSLGAESATLAVPVDIRDDDEVGAQSKPPRASSAAWPLGRNKL
jgi:NADP-dependent 3-hydroxy acid dehydrogenase YdfG